MATKQRDPVLVVVELNGGNDYLNTVVPYADPNYYDNRDAVRIDEGDVLKLDDQVGLNPNMVPMKEIYEAGDMDIVHGVGYENPSRSHFRSMDIWHTCEPEIVGTEGWVGGPLERSIHREKTLSLPYTSGTASPEHWSRRMCPWLRCRTSPTTACSPA